MKTTNLIYLFCCLALCWSCKKEKPLEAAATLDLFQITGTDYASCALEVNGETWIPVSSLKNNGDWTSHIMRFTPGGAHINSHEISVGNGHDHRVLSALMFKGKLCLGGMEQNTPRTWVIDTSNWALSKSWMSTGMGRNFDICELNNNLFITGEYVSASGSDKDISLFKFNGAVDLLDNKTWGGPENDGGIKLAVSNGDLLVLSYAYQAASGRDILVYRMDEDLVTLDSNLIVLSGYDQASDFLVEQDRILVFAHSTSNNSGTHDALILELDFDLNVLRKKFISLGSHEGVDAVRVLNNGNYGLVSYGDMNIRSGLYLELDKELNLVYHRRYPDVSGFFHLSEDGERRVFWGQTNGPDLQLSRVSDVFP